MVKVLYFIFVPVSALVIGCTSHQIPCLGLTSVSKLCNHSPVIPFVLSSDEFERCKGYTPHGSSYYLRPELSCVSKVRFPIDIISRHLQVYLLHMAYCSAREAEDVAREALQVSRSPALEGTLLARSAKRAAASTRSALHLARAAAAEQLRGASRQDSERVVRAAEFGATAAEASFDAVVQAVIDQGDAANPSALDLAGKAEIAATYLLTASNISKPIPGNPLRISFHSPTTANKPSDSDLGLIDAATLLQQERARNEALASENEFLANRLEEQAARKNKRRKTGGAPKPPPVPKPQLETKTTGVGGVGDPVKRSLRSTEKKK